MIKIHSSLFTLDIDRKKEIIERAAIVNDYYHNNYSKKYFGHYDYYFNNIDIKLDKCISIYKLLFKDELNNADKSLLFLYILIPNDDNFIKMIINYKFDFDKISTFYAVPNECIIYRYKCYREIKNNNKKLVKEIEKDL